MSTRSLSISLDIRTNNLMSEVLFLSGRTLVSEALVRLKDHLKIIEHISLTGVRYFRGGHRTVQDPQCMDVLECESSVFSFDLSIDSLSYGLLQSSAYISGRPLTNEASLRLKDSLRLFKWVGESGERQWWMSLSSSDKDELPSDLFFNIPTNHYFCGGR